MNEKVYPGARDVCPEGRETASLFQKTYTVSEAVRLIGVESHVLRYWEEELEISIERTSQGHRIYSQQNVELFCRVKELREEGLQLKAIRRVLDQANGKSPEQPEFQEFCGDYSGSADERGQWHTAGDFGEMKKTEAEGESDILDGDGEPCDAGYEIVSVREPEGGLEHFVAVLKQMMEEVVREENEKLKLDMEECIREKMEELYLQYFQVIQEAAAAGAEEKPRESALRRLLRRLFGK